MSSFRRFNPARPTRLISHTVEPCIGGVSLQREERGWIVLEKCHNRTVLIPKKIEVSVLPSQVDIQLRGLRMLVSSRSVAYFNVRTHGQTCWSKRRSQNPIHLGKGKEWDNVTKGAHTRPGWQTFCNTFWLWPSRCDCWSTRTWPPVSNWFSSQSVRYRWPWHELEQLSSFSSPPYTVPVSIARVSLAE